MELLSSIVHLDTPALWEHRLRWMQEQGGVVAVTADLVLVSCEHCHRWNDRTQTPSRGVPVLDSAAVTSGLARDRGTRPVVGDLLAGEWD